MSSETRRASLGWEGIRACVPQVHGTEGPEGVHRSGLKSMTVEKAEVYGRRGVGWWEESLFVS